MLRPAVALGPLALLALAPFPAAARQEEPAYDGKKGSAWVDTLVNDPSARRRAIAVEALARLWADKRYKESLPNLGRALRVDSSVAVRAAAAAALGSLKPDDAPLVAKDLSDALGNERESRVKREIARTLGRYPQVARLSVTALTDALADPEAATRAAVAEALAQAGREAKPAAAELAPLLADKDRAVRRAAVIALGRISPEGASAIAETMGKMLGTEKDQDMRLELVTSLGLLGEAPPPVVRALAGLLTDPEDETRRRAARTLGLFGTKAAGAADALLKAADADKLKDVRVDAVRAFGSALGPDLKGRAKDLLGLLKDPEFEVRIAVVEEVGALGNELKDDVETLKVLRGRLSDQHVKVREATSAAIRKIEKKPDPKKDGDKKDPDKKDG